MRRFVRVCCVQKEKTKCTGYVTRYAHYKKIQILNTLFVTVFIYFSKQSIC